MVPQLHDMQLGVPNPGTKLVLAGLLLLAGVSKQWFEAV